MASPKSTQPFGIRLRLAIEQCGYDRDHAAKVLRVDVAELDSWIADENSRIYSKPHFLMIVGALHTLHNLSTSVQQCKSEYQKKIRADFVGPKRKKGRPKKIEFQ